jgi:molybdopterin synthase catalytic subunit
VRIEIRETPFHPWEELQRYEDEVVTAHSAGKFGASAVFVGSMRDFNQGDTVQGMSLEHYPGMTEKELQRIINEARGQWQLLDELVLHRVGALQPNEPIVLVAVWSAHRKEAFEACRHIMEALKSRAPFWKKEELAESSRWVDNNSDGY